MLFFPAIFNLVVIATFVFIVTDSAIVVITVVSVIVVVLNAWKGLLVYTSVHNGSKYYSTIMTCYTFV
ncbi:hypothetical protein Avbf_13992 [Armadillidium vulgare]|nr:hypothetical protein Avbf_13992 [Armadillidium vulgare]